MRLLLFALVFAAALAQASHYNDIPHKVKECIHGPPHGRLKHGPAPMDLIVVLKIALTQPHVHILEKHLLEVSDPNHQRYGAYLSKTEAEELMAPHPESLDAVSEWLSSYDIGETQVSRSSARDWVTIRVPVSIAEEMLKTKYDVYVHSSGETTVRTTGYSLPGTLHGHIELIQPTTMFSRLRPFKSTLHWSSNVSTCSSSSAPGTIIGPAGNPVDSSCNCTITLHCLKQLYNAVGYNTSATNGDGIAITSYLEQYVNDRDLQQFLRIQNPAAYGSNYTLVSTYAAAGTEANLDTQYAFGLTHPTAATAYSPGGLAPVIRDALNESNEPYFDWLHYVSSQENLPQTISTGYGDDEQTVPKNYAVRVCKGFAALGSRGISIMFASGDGGVGGGNSPNTSSICHSNDGSNRTVFIPQFPASCPFVTSVGGTRRIPELASSFSGRGFSNYNAKLTKYLDTLTPGTYEGMYNPNGRDIPDVAAQYSHFQIVDEGQVTHAGGTSCSAPTFAAIISMINDALISASKPSLGFLNPWLYKKGYLGLNDITMGSNPACGTLGFNASIGWDPVTGLGTPNFRKLLELAGLDLCFVNHYPSKGLVG